jgi:hypothetical protein
LFREKGIRASDLPKSNRIALLLSLGILEKFNKKLLVGV